MRRSVSSEGNPVFTISFISKKQTKMAKLVQKLTPDTSVLDTSVLPRGIPAHAVHSISVDSIPPKQPASTVGAQGF